MIHPTFLPMPYMRAYVLYLSTLPFGTARRGRQRAEHTVRQHYGWVWTSKLRCEREARPGRTTRPTCRAGSLSFRRSPFRSGAGAACVRTCAAQAVCSGLPSSRGQQQQRQQQPPPNHMRACLLISPHCLLCRPSSSINKAHT